LRVAIPLPHSRGVFPVDETILLHPTNRHFDDFLFVLAEDGFFGYEVNKVLANRLAHFLAVALTVTSTAVRAQRI
jgi:hypothetical protein